MYGRRNFFYLLMISIFMALSVNATADEVTYTMHIRPVFEAKCSVCHGPDSPEYPDFEKDKAKYRQSLRGPRMDTYSYLVSFIGWLDTGAVMRRLDDGKNTKDGKSGNMYQYLGGTEEERQQNLRLFKAWVGNWTLKRWPDISKEELNGLKVKY